MNRKWEYVPFGGNVPGAGAFVVVDNRFKVDVDYKLTLNNGGITLKEPKEDISWAPLLVIPIGPRVDKAEAIDVPEFGVEGEVKGDVPGGVCTFVPLPDVDVGGDGQFIDAGGGENFVARPVAAPPKKRPANPL